MSLKFRLKTTRYELRSYHYHQQGRGQKELRYIQSQKLALCAICCQNTQPYFDKYNLILLEGY